MAVVVDIGNDRAFRAAGGLNALQAGKAARSFVPRAGSS
jgi:hypothetical protein